ncbi:hypothetical protein [Enterocloster lavalensis]|uniref:hypothetical protein n=1 Tax=Enterocloster lavalensis TaxID=460384 RepID=UPI002047305E|nr:hypothetical protein [Enterocloster lavalensis]DAE72583.1 MAG TPA: PROTEIN (MANNOSE-BINDING PROTEIN A), HOST DEFENSE, METALLOPROTEIN, SUGAR.9A [Caudoviricetes sp.]
MAYTPHNWVDGELITAEKLNDLEQAAGQAAQPGPKGDKGDPGAGLTGTAIAIADLAADADTATIVTKINDILTELRTRGVIGT